MEIIKSAHMANSVLEGKVKLLEQSKLVLEQGQVKLEKEVENLKRKRRSTPSPPPNKTATTPNEEGKVIPAGYRTICHAESNIILDDGVSAVASYFIARTTPLYYSLRYSKVVSWLALRHLKLVGRLVWVCKFASCSCLLSLNSHA
jgi:hypothetical protein